MIINPEWFCKYGNTVYVERDGRKEAVKAFIQPLRLRHCLYLKKRYISADFFDNFHLLYVGPAEYPLSKGMRISYKDMCYTIISTEVVTAHDKDIYVWAILR